MKGLSVKNRATRVSISAILVALMMAATTASSCSGDDSNQSSGQAKIGPEGGTVSAPGGASVVIPPGALSEETTITVTTITEENMSEHVPDLAIFYGGANFGPDGTTFEKPVTISFPVDQPLPEGSQVPLYIYDKEDGSFRETEFMATIGEGGRSLSAEVTHFSTFLEIMPVSVAILEAVKNQIGDGSDPDTALVNYANWFINEAIKPYDFWTISNGCCYTFVGAFFDLTYKRDDVEFTAVLSDGETSSLEQQLTYAEDYESNDHRFILQFRVHLYIGVEPDLQIDIEDPQLETEESTRVTATLLCNGEPMVGNDITFSVDNNGTVNPSSGETDSQGEVSVTFLAEDEGVATVSADHDAAHCQGNQSSFGMSDIINIGESNAWMGTATAHRLIDNGCYMDEADYSIVFNFVLLDPVYGTVSGIATAQQDVTVEITDHNFCVGNANHTMTLENLEAPETLDLIMAGYYNHLTDEFEWLRVELDEDNVVDFYNFDICSNFPDGTKECHSASGDLWRETLHELYFEYLPRVETTTSGTWPCDNPLFTCSSEWTITLQRAK